MSSPQGLQAVGLFEGIADKELSELAAMATPIKIARDVVLIEESARGSEVYAILEGRVAITLRLPNRAESETIAELKNGDVLGESVLLGRQRRVASAVAQGEVSALRWEVEQLNDYFIKHPHCGFIVMRNLACILQERLAATNMMLRNAFNRFVDIL